MSIIKTLDEIDEIILRGEHDGRCDHCDEPGQKLYLYNSKHHNGCLICIFCWTSMGLEFPEGEL